MLAEIFYRKAHHVKKVGLSGMLLIAALVLFAGQAVADTYSQVTNLSGTSVVNGITVTVTSSDSVSSASSVCGNSNLGPYALGSPALGGPGSYTFTFSKPVLVKIPVLMDYYSVGDMKFMVNGNPYMLTSDNLSGGVATPTCGNNTPLVISGGDLSNFGLTYVYATQEVSIPTAVTSITVSTSAADVCYFGLLIGELPTGIPPGQPTMVTATSVDRRGTVSFAAPADNGGNSITGYTVTSNPSGGLDTDAGSTSLSHSIYGLTMGASYTFTVTAANINGNGPASAASNSVTMVPIPGSSAFVNGGFEDGDDNLPPPGWTITTGQNNNGILIFPPTSIADLNIQSGGLPLTNTVHGTNKPDPTLGEAASLRYALYGQASAVVNNLGSNYNVNRMKQTGSVTAADVDPTDGKIHVRYAIAPILENPGHPDNQQPYFYLELRNVTKGIVLSSKFNYSNQPGVPWQTVSNTGLLYTDWQLYDIAPGNAALSVGDVIELEVIVAGCAQGGHFGEVYVDGISTSFVGLSISATGPLQATAGGNLTYKYTYSNSDSVDMTGVIISETLPANTTFQSITPPAGFNCTTPAVGASGTIYCGGGTLLAGVQGTMQMTVSINPTAVGTIDNGTYSIRSDQKAQIVGPLVTTTLVPLAAPTTDAATQITVSGFTANWETVAEATGYYLDVATDYAFTNIIQPNINVGNVTSYTVAGLTSNTAYYYRVRSSKGGNYSSNSVPIIVTTVYGAQTITFTNPGVQIFGTTPTLTAMATSGLTPTFTSSTSGVCTITSGGMLTFVTSGECTISADQPGNSSFSAAPQVTQNFTVAKATPVITWGTPAAVTVGTSLSATQLNASSGAVAGAFSYSPFLGTIMSAVGTQTLSVTFTPTDTANFNTPAAVTVAINVAAAGQTAIDTAAPDVTVFTIPATATTLTVAITALTATDMVGVTGYLLSESATPPLASDMAWTAAAPTAHMFPTWGNHTIYAYAKDAAGNVSDAKQATVLIGTADGVIVPAPANAPPKTEPQLSDALKSLNFAMKVEIPTPTEILHGDVAPLVNGVPQPDGEINLGDTIVILRRVVGL